MLLSIKAKTKWICSILFRTVIQLHSISLVLMLDLIRDCSLSVASHSVQVILSRLFTRRKTNYSERTGSSTTPLNGWIAFRCFLESKQLLHIFSIYFSFCYYLLYLQFIQRLATRVDGKKSVMFIALDFNGDKMCVWNIFQCQVDARFAYRFVQTSSTVCVCALLSPAIFFFLFTLQHVRRATICSKTRKTSTSVS